MPKKKSVTAEIVLRSEASLVPAAESRQAAFDRMVRERVDEVMAERVASQFEPEFQSREVSWEIQRRQTVFDRKKWSLYFDKWGCRVCGRKDVGHVAHAHCSRCLKRVVWRLAAIKREYDRANPEKEIERDIDRLTSRIRTAKSILGNGRE